MLLNYTNVDPKPPDPLVVFLRSATNSIETPLKSALAS